MRCAGHSALAIYYCNADTSDMKLLRKLPNSVREAPGLEWALLKKLPLVLLFGTLFPLAISLANRWFPPEGSAVQIAKHVTTVDIMAIAAAVTVWTAVLTVAIGCFVVLMMKGPGYVADAYPLDDADRPGRR
jgi:hypothetical protein